MNGSVTRRAKSGKPSWGYYLLAGRDENGKRIQVTKSGFKTKNEADDALQKALADYKARRDACPVQKIPTIAAFFDRWMAEHATRKCAPKTIERYRELGACAIRQVLEIGGSPVTVGEINLDKFGPMQAEQMVNMLRDRGGQKTNERPEGRPLSAKTVRHVACVIHGCFEKAVKWQIIDRNPMHGVDLPKIDRKPPCVVEKEGVSLLLARARTTRLYPLILLALATGARRGELLALQWSDLDFESGIVNISKSLEQTREGLRVKSTKSNKPRRFAVPAVALMALKEHRAEQNNDREQFGATYQENDLVFCRPEGTYYSPVSLGCRVARMMKEAGLAGVSLHSLRHTHASELLSQGVPIPTVAKRLGHANANITLSIYAHALEADELAAAKIWGDPMATVIGENKRQWNGSLAKSSANTLKAVQTIERIGAADGVRTRDFQNHNLALLPAELQPPQLMQL